MTAPSLILPVVTALSAMSVVPTAEVAILSVVIALFEISMVAMVPSRILSVVTLESTNLAVLMVLFWMLVASIPNPSILALVILTLANGISLS